MYVPLYKVGSLGGPPTMLHGIAKDVTGPWDWNSRPEMPTNGENPAAVVYKNVTTGATVYSIWIGGVVRVSSSPDGPFTDGGRYPGGNPAPLFHNGAFYTTSQGTTTVCPI